METLKFKKLIEDFNNGVIYNDNPSFVSLIVVEDLLKRKRQEFLDRTQEYVDYLSKKLKINVYDFAINSFLFIKATEKVFNPITYGMFVKTLNHYVDIILKQGLFLGVLVIIKLNQNILNKLKMMRKLKST